MDVVLNPLGVPSRMNVGQIFETHLGWACAGLGRQIADPAGSLAGRRQRQALQDRLRDIYGPDEELPDDDEELIELARNLSKGVPIATPVFDGAHIDDIERPLEQAGLSGPVRCMLFDGQYGRAVQAAGHGRLHLYAEAAPPGGRQDPRPVHRPLQPGHPAPLGGKAQFGGQRFGEMEVWALEAYGAAYTLQEMLTVKSDDVAGRTKVYESIVRGDDAFEAGIPESFNVLVKEMRSLGLNVELENS